MTGTDTDVKKAIVRAYKFQSIHVMKLPPEVAARYSVSEDSEIEIEQGPEGFYCKIRKPEAAARTAP